MTIRGCHPVVEVVTACIQGRWINRWRLFQHLHLLVTTSGLCLCMAVHCCGQTIDVHICILKIVTHSSHLYCWQCIDAVSWAAGPLSCCLKILCPLILKSLILNPLLSVVTTNFVAKLVLFLWQIDVKVYLTNFSVKWSIQTPVSITSFLKNGMRVYCLDLEIRRNILSLWKI